MADVGIHTETERKFLVLSDAFKAEAVASHRIRQGYIARDNGNSVRVRIKDNTGILTIKGPSVDDISRTEWEIEIPLPDAEALLKLCHGGIIDKTRYIVPEAGTLSQTPGHPRPGKREGPKAARSAAPGRGREATVGDSVPASGRVFEVDEFYGDNEGLVMAEIELENASDPFEKPSWLGREVTGDRHYYNSYLSLHPFKTW
ncbi:MAG: CYTH domain-containing protein [Bacteroidales bacterium]|nr:CYTH domain-containing protein [Bacteroidales bacterium]